MLISALGPCRNTICLSSPNVCSYLENRFLRLNSFTLVQELILICIKAFRGGVLIAQ